MRRGNQACIRSREFAASSEAVHLLPCAASNGAALPSRFCWPCSPMEVAFDRHSGAPIDQVFVMEWRLRARAPEIFVRPFSQWRAGRAPDLGEPGIRSLLTRARESHEYAQHSKEKPFFFRGCAVPFIFSSEQARGVSKSSRISTAMIAICGIADLNHSGAWTEGRAGLMRRASL